MPAAQADNRFPYTVMSATTFRRDQLRFAPNQDPEPIRDPHRGWLARSLVSQDRPEHCRYTNPFYNRLRPEAAGKGGLGIRHEGPLHGPGSGPAADGLFTSAMLAAAIVAEMSAADLTQLTLDSVREYAIRLDADLAQGEQ
jgi:hypothetical protein